ncbi:MAG: Uma2 family endonuclease [Armatimonadetes bacterium]|nr:Uma2 family endonuclease [Armatimonadota bacterium]
MITDSPLLVARFPGLDYELSEPFPKFYLPDDRAFFEFCNANSDSTLFFEREPDGEVRLTPPSGSETGRANATILGLLFVWNMQNGEPGYVFDAPTGFTLPSGAIRAPDVSYVAKARYDALTEDEQAHHAPIAPDFVVEVMSPSDRLPKQQDKMREYMTNGVRLGWLIHRKTRTVHTFRQGADMETLADVATVADPELPGFTLSTARVFPAES